jgi:predicted methyltransferase
MRSHLLVLALIAVSPACASTSSGTASPAQPAAAVQSPATDAKLASVLAGSQRSEANNARDKYRHPAETLGFFGLRDNMTVVEIAPGGGWYTEILAPYLRDNGVFYAAGMDPNSSRPYNRKSAAEFLAKLTADPKTYDKVKVTIFEPPQKTDIAPEGSADMVLTFRNVHNWMAAGTAPEAFRAFYRALKPGGVLGVVEHRADPKAPADPTAPTGYVPESTILRFAEDAGFKLAGRSEINANPRDTKDHPKGVWTLPPTYRLGETDRARYEAIGESDRMTLKFVKP